MQKPQNPPDYHLGELAIATREGDPRRCLPETPPPHLKVLDIGCGAGQTLAGIGRRSEAVGLDVDEEALRLGRKLAPELDFVCGVGEAIPFADGAFDYVITRVSLPYMDIPAALKEIRRILRPGGRLWMALHTVAHPWASVRAGNWRSWIYFAYVVINSGLFHATGRMISFLGKRYESFQTEAGMKRALKRAGFADVRRVPGNHFVLEATVAGKTQEQESAG